MFLDRFSVGDIRLGRALSNKLLQYHWDYYAALAFQRAKIRDQLLAGLRQAAITAFDFSGWQRALKFKYALNPLSTRGSLADPGGRFNVGAIAPSRLPAFPALYLAHDKETALPELLGQPDDMGGPLTALEVALAAPGSVALVSMHGRLDTVVNLKEPQNIQAFVSLIRDFTIPGHLLRQARTLGLPLPRLVRTPSELVEMALQGDWRAWPMRFDVPSPSQIFGHLVCEAGIEGILYPSKFGGKECLCVYPQNFGNSGSFVELTGDVPAEVTVRRLDAKSMVRDRP